MPTVQLCTGNAMPQQMMGTSLWEEKGRKDELLRKLKCAVEYAAGLRKVGFDTARDYNNERELGDIFKDIISKGLVRRDELFITTKVGNSQQTSRNMRAEIDQSLKNLQLDYVDLWMLHWPLPGYWEDNWNQMIELFKEGKARAIGIANVRERHLTRLVDLGMMLPSVVQVECHPFRSIPSLVDYCKSNGIVVEAYSSNCNMLPIVRDNQVLKMVAEAHQCSLAQIIAKWHIQRGVVPIFRSFNVTHIKENVDLDDIILSDDEMDMINSLDRDYKFHPESLNCPGY